MRFKTLTTLLLSIIPGIVLAQGAETQCTYGDMVRRVVIMSEPGVSVPCEVHYYKDTEAPGAKQVLWRAMNEASYCEDKAEAFIVKLQDLGWSCGQNQAAGTPAAAEPALEDDTEALAPAAEPAPVEEAEPAAE